MRTCVLLGSLLLLSTCLAPHRAVADAPARLVIDLEGREPALVLAQVQGVLGEGFVAEVRPVDEVLDAGLGPWVVSAPGQLTACPGQPTSQVALEAGLTEAERLIEELEFHAARDLLGELEGRLCASQDPLDPATWARIPFLLGLVQFYIDDKGSAREAFREAGERQPGLEWDVRFAPEPQQTFLLGLNDAVHSTRARVAPPEAGAEFFVDGQPLAPGGATQELTGERHVVQVRGADGGLAGAMLTVREEGTIQLRDRAGLVADLRQPPASDVGGAAYAVLADAARAGGYAEVLVLTDPSGADAWWFNAIDGHWKPAGLDLGERLELARRQRTGGGVLLGAGVGVAIGGAALGLGQLSQTSALEPQMASSAALYDALLPEYREHQVAAAVGFGVLAAGAAMAAAGLATASRGARAELELQAATPVQVGVLVTPAGVGVAGRF